MMLNYLANDSVQSSSSNDEEDVDFIPLVELACSPKIVWKRDCWM